MSDIFKSLPVIPLIKFLTSAVLYAISLGEFENKDCFILNKNCLKVDKLQPPEITQY